MLMLIADAWPVVMAQRGDFLFPSQVANSGLGCSKFQCLIPETLVREATSRKSEEKEKEQADKAGGRMHFDNLGTYFFFFQNFSGPRTGLSSKSRQGGGKERGKPLVDGQLCACSGLGTNVIFPNLHKNTALLRLSSSTLQIRKRRFREGS